MCGFRLFVFPRRGRERLCAAAAMRSRRCPAACLCGRPPQVPDKRCCSSAHREKAGSAPSYIPAACRRRPPVHVAKTGSALPYTSAACCRCSPSHRHESGHVLPQTAAVQCGRRQFGKSVQTLPRFLVRFALARGAAGAVVYSHKLYGQDRENTLNPVRKMYGTVRLCADAGKVCGSVQPAAVCSRRSAGAAGQCVPPRRPDRISPKTEKERKTT